MLHAPLTGLCNLRSQVDEVRVFEARVAIQLDAGEAIYSERLARLYFCDGPGRPVGETIAAALSGLGLRAEITPVRIDDLGFFSVARKVALPPSALVPVVTALRLAGVDVSGAGREILRRAAE